MPPETWERLLQEREIRPVTGQLDIEDLLLKTNSNPAPAPLQTQPATINKSGPAGISPARRRALKYAS
jgi:hypothetical protein